MLRGACSTNVEVMIAVLYFVSGIDQNIPHPATFEDVACSFPCLCIFVIDIMLRLDSDDTILSSALPAEELDKEWYLR
jgi:hypothetical protein